MIFLVVLVHGMVPEPYPHPNKADCVANGYIKKQQKHIPAKVID